MNTSQTMKLALCSGVSVPREPGPATSNATPLAKTTIVETTTIGAITRNAVGGGPLAR